MNIYYIAICLSIFFIIIKFIENKFIIKSPDFKIKNIFKDAVIIFVLTIIIYYFYNNYFNIVATKSETKVFLNRPDF
tara:strand:- start:334 stop:564 length:231 start_codon:yes stop_codon:yes gene_type:complete